VLLDKLGEHIPKEGWGGDGRGRAEWADIRWLEGGWASLNGAEEKRGKVKKELPKEGSSLSGLVFGRIKKV